RRMSAAHRRRGTRPPAAGPAWSAEEEALLGTMPDEEVARRTGRTLVAVQGRRYTLRIEKYGRRGRGLATGRPGPSGGSGRGWAPRRRGTGGGGSERPPGHPAASAGAAARLTGSARPDLSYEARTSR